MEDGRILALFSARDERAIAETAAKYGRLCFRVAMNILGNREDAEECVNDAYLAAWNAIPPAEPGSFPAFLCRVARNLALKRLDFKTAVKRAPGVLTALSELEDVLPDDSLAPGTDDGELTAAIDRFLRGEKPEARNVFLRKYWFFDSVGEIAARYSFSESRVKSTLFRTREKLREYLKKEGFCI